GRDRHPGVALGGALAQQVAVGGELVEGVVVPGGDEVEAAGHLGVADGAARAARHLGAPDLLAGVAAQAGQAAHRLGEEAAGPGQPDVPVVRLVPHHHAGAQAQPGEEVAAGVAVPDEAVHDPHVLGARVEVQADGEGQPVAVPALRPDDRADGPVLLDGDALDPAGGPLAVYGAALVGGGPVLAQADQADVAEDLPAVAGGGADQRLPRVLDRPGDGPGAHGEPPVLAGDGDGRRGRGGLLPRVEPVRAVAGRYGGVGGPLDRAVRPGGG